MSELVKIEKNKAGLEDLTFGTEVETQSRNGVSVPVTQINAQNMPFDASRNLQTALDTDYPAVEVVATDIDNVNTTATNINDVRNFALVYQVSATEPTQRSDTTPLQAGDLWFDTVAEGLKKYNGSIYVDTTADAIATAAMEFTNKTMDSITNTIHADVVHLEIQALEDLVRGDVVTVDGASDTTMKVRKRNSLTEPASAIIEVDVLTGNTATAISTGIMKNLDNDGVANDGVAWAVKDILYPNTAGGLTKTPVIANGYYNQPVAYVVKANPSKVTLQVNFHSGHDLANLVAYDNTNSELVATNVQDALDEVNQYSASQLATSVQQSGTNTITNTITTLGYDGVTYTGQTSSSNATYQNGVGGVFDQATDTLLLGHFYWNATAGTLTATVETATGTTTVDVPASEGYLNTGIKSIDFTVNGNGTGYYNDRTTPEVGELFTVRVGSDHPDLGQDLGFGIVANGDEALLRGYSECLGNISEVHIKARNGIEHNNVCNGLMGVGNRIETDTTIAETFDATTLTAFNSNGASLGADTLEKGFNKLNETYILYQELFTHIKWSKTNQGKNYLEAFNPVTGEGIELYEGSGLAGHSIPHSAGKNLDLSIVKNLTSTADWMVNTLMGEDGATLGWLNKTDTMSRAEWASSSDVVFTVLSQGTADQSNTINHLYSMSYKTKSTTWGIETFIGKGAVNFIETRDINGDIQQPVEVIVKRTDSIGGWALNHSKQTHALFLNLSSAEQTISDYDVVIVPNGFRIDTTNAQLNAIGGQYTALVRYDTNKDGGGSYFPKPVDNDEVADNSVINILDGNFGICKGKGANGFIHNFEAFIGDLPLALFAGATDGKKWVYYTEGGTWGYKDLKPSNGMYNKQFADDNRLVFQDGVYRETSGSELLVDGSSNYIGDFNQANGALVAPYTAWVARQGDEQIEVASNRLAITNGATGFGGIKKTFSTEIGEKYIIDATLEAGTASMAILIGGVEITSRYEYLATSTATEVIVTINSATLGHYAYCDDITLFKKQPTLSTVVPNISLIRNPIMVASETPQYIDYIDELAKNVVDDLVVLENAEFKGDVTIRGGFDLEQKWQDVKSERVAEVVYINDTGKPIELYISVGGTNTTTAYLEVDGLNRQSFNQQLSATAFPFRESVTIPNNSEYVLRGTGTILIWHELRKGK